jgi:enoyl-CoA hydratase
MSGSGLRVERRGRVGWLVFDRPEAGNAFDAAMLAALPKAWRSLDDDPGVGAIVVTGTGASFQTGLDLTALARDPAGLRDATRRTREGQLAITGWHLAVRTPVITAVNGVCAGGGLHFVVDADIVIAADNATFLDPHVSVGQASAWEAIGLARRVAAGAAARVALLGRHERLDAARAYELGLVSELVAPADLPVAAQRLGEVVAGADPALVRVRKAGLWSALEAGLGAATRLAATSG